jgi:SET domain-containing protein
MKKLKPKKPKINPDYTWFDLKVVRSPIHRYGVVANVDISKKKWVIEYTGVLMNRRQHRWMIDNTSEERQIYIWQVAKGQNDSANWDWVIDGWTNGSGAEFINHSCDPNLYMHFIGRRGYYVSLRPIKKGEELTIDYAFRWEKDEKRRVKCNCGSPKCRGWINRER